MPAHPVPSGRTNATMPKIEPYNAEPNDDPPAAFATDAEIEIADQLRHQLEKRYLAQSETSPPLPVAVNDDREELL
jgi:hypothetical protein